MKESTKSRLAALVLAASLAIITLCLGKTEVITDPEPKPLVQKVTMRLTFKQPVSAGAND